MLGHPGQRVAQAGEVLGGGRPVHPLDGANRRGTGRSNSAPAGRVAPERPHCSRREEIVGPEALGECPCGQDLDAVIGPPRMRIQAHDDSLTDPGMVFWISSITTNRAFDASISSPSNPGSREKRTNSLAARRSITRAL